MRNLRNLCILRRNIGSNLCPYGKVISSRVDHDWPACSPDLTVCEFFLWGSLKDKIWSQPINLQRTCLQDLKDQIQYFGSNMDNELIQRSFQGMVNCVNKCINVHGSTFSDE